jgi:hypothetical protein
MNRIKDLTGRRFHKLVVEKLDYIHQKRGAYWICICDCGNKKSIIGARLSCGDIKSCGCLSKSIGGTRQWCGYGKISGNHWYNIRRNSVKGGRKLVFDITIEYVWNLYQKQRGLCAISKLPIDFATRDDVKCGKEQTASLDRIDSTLGYIEDNVQWVHKTINKMKSDLDQSNFIKMCEAVAKTNGEKNGKD